MASIHTEEGTITIIPSRKFSEKHLVFNDNRNPEASSIRQPTICGIDGRSEIRSKMTNLQFRSSQVPSGSQLKTYRLAIVTTGEFYQANGNSDGEVLMAIAFSVNSLNLIYERDMAMTFILANTPILFNNPATDPFIPDNPGVDDRLDQAQSVISANFNTNDYDIGHVLHTHAPNDGWSSGGVANLAGTCNNFDFSGNGPYKSGGWSGGFENTSNDWLSLFAHEIGHMFGATHTFNGTGSNCTGNINPISSVEIGSGSTIMSYNGLCQNNNDIPSSGEADNYFHTLSMLQMNAYSDLNNIGSSCGTRVQINNDIPVLDGNPNNVNYTVPIATPFELEGQAIDNEEGQLTYVWEQMDEDGSASTATQGYLGSTAGASNIAPLFRSFPPSSSPKRIFPSLESILAGNNTGQAFEALPTVERNISFAFTVRDNFPNGGAVNTTSVSVIAEDLGGPFEITSQNNPSQLTYDGSNTFEVLWNVAGTTGGNIQCSEVEIYFSEDGGNTFPYLLASNETNDGSATITVPNISTTGGRIKVKAIGNIFFDINDAPITINSSCEAYAATFSPDETIIANEGSTNLDLNLNSNYGNLISAFTGVIESSDQGGILALIDNGSCFEFLNTTYSDAIIFEVSQSGEYTFNRSNSGKGINIYQGDFFPNNPCTNLIATSNGLQSPFLVVGSSVTTTLTKGVKYFLVPNTVDNPPINYSISYTGPGQIYDQNPPPGQNYSYTYVIIDEGVDTIVGFSDDPDLSQAGTYSAGTYEIRGLSYENSSFTTSLLNSNYAGNTLFEFTSNTLFGPICARLNQNSKLITILDSLSEQVQFDLKVFLEGTLSEGTMRTTANDFDYLPGETNNQNQGHPYDVLPWNYNTYSGAEYGNGGIPYPSTVVDWVLLSVRTNGYGPGNEVYRTTALLHRDGRVEIPAGESSLQVNLLGTTNYLVIEHINHLAIISPGLFLTGNILSFDFTTNDSSDPNNFGGLTQKSVGNYYAMYSGNTNQSTANNRIVFNGSDFNVILPQNGNFGYLTGDLNQSITVDGADFNLLLLLNGLFGCVTWD